MEYKENNNIMINNIEFNVSLQATAKIADSFVVNSNKTGTGRGESRLYISSQHHDSIFEFSENDTIEKGNKSYHLCLHKCFLEKDNLTKYLEDAKSDYLYPKSKYREDISLLYEDRLNLVNSLDNELYFNIFNQNGAFDSNRFYIGSIEKAWNIIRSICLPKVTTVNIYKLLDISNPDNILYYFELSYDNLAQKDIKYSYKKQEKITINQIKNDTTIDTTEKTTIINARKGQGKFRKNVLQIMPSCPFTNITLPSLLRASHIMPWIKCTNNNQRLDGYNGLTLTPTYDVLFDSGLISFKNDGTLLISDRLSRDIIISLNLEAGKQYNIMNLNGKRNNYLEYHRTYIFN